MLEERLMPKLNLQLFADSGDGEDIEDLEGEEKETITLTQEELNKQLQAEADRRVTKALETAKSKWETEYKAKLEEEREEAKRLAELTAEEREKELAAKTAKELEETKAKLRHFQLEQDTISRLAEEGLDISFKNFLIGEDETKTNENIKAFKEVFNAAVQDKVNERLKGKTPQGITSGPINPTKNTKTLDELAQNARII